MTGLALLASPWMPHLVLAPIALPLATGALLLLVREERQRLKLAVNIGSTVLGLLLAIALLQWIHQTASSGSMGVYLPGNWPAPWGITLVLDRLAALMLVLTYLVALCAIVFAGARWHRAGVLFHSLFQFQIMGLCGAFLTGDLFNLFVFFEIMLAASSGLLLHGSGQARVQSGLHYIAVNLLASSLFLIGAAMLYGITGTLNMADLARTVPEVSAANRGLLHAGAAILATAFLIKAAAWPLNFWLVPAYGSATAPVGALFALMTKVGIYALLRLWTLMFGSTTDGAAPFGSLWLTGIGMASMAFGAIGMFSTQRITTLAGHATVLSSGTLLAVMGFGQATLTGALLYYLPSSTLGVATLFLLADLATRWRNDGATLAPHERNDSPFLSPELLPTAGVNLDDDEAIVVGRVIQATAAFLGLAFMIAALVVAGLPPLSGFIGKFAMLDALLHSISPPGLLHWLLLAWLLGTGLVALMALARSGMQHFWAGHRRQSPELRVLEGLPVAVLLLVCILLTTQADTVLRYTRAAAADLHDPARYIHSVLSTPTKTMP